MKLYYSKGACSLSPHIALREAGLSFDLEAVDLAKKRTASGADFTALNAKGYVPALLLDSGELLTEGPALVQYIADLAPAKQLAPANGTLARVQLQSWLNYICVELHRSFAPLFHPEAGSKEYAKEYLARRFALVNERLRQHAYLLGDTYSVADIYLYVILRWCPYVGIDTSVWPALVAFVDKVAARPAVQEALKAEGIKK